MANDGQIARDLVAKLRQEVDEIDKEIIDLVKKRTVISASIARVKRSNGLPVVTGSRERDVFARYAGALGQLGKTMVSAILLQNKQPVSDEVLGGSPSEDSRKTP